MPDGGHDHRPCNRERVSRSHRGMSQPHIRPRDWAPNDRSYGSACDACGHEWDVRHGVDQCPLCESPAHPVHEFEEVPWADSAFVAIGRD